MALRIEFKDILDEVKKNEAAYVRIAVIGQPGAGKSSLINALLGKNVAPTGPETDNTVSECVYEYNFQRIVDLPGYATERFSFEKWKEEFSPQQYDIFLYVFRGKFLEEDNKLFSDLETWNEERRRPIFLIRNFSAGLDGKEKANISSDISRQIGVKEPAHVYFLDMKPPKMGIQELQSAILKTDFSSILIQRLQKGFCAARMEYIYRCREKSSGEISMYTKMAAVNGINPILGADVAVDLGIYFKMFGAIREVYGIDDADLNGYVALPIAKKLLELATKEGVVLLLKNFAGRSLVRSMAKFVPFVGQGISAGISYKMADYIGHKYDDDCCEMAKAVMDELIDDTLELYFRELGLESNAKVF